MPQYELPEARMFEIHGRATAEREHFLAQLQDAERILGRYRRWLQRAAADEGEAEELARVIEGGGMPAGYTLCRDDGQAAGIETSA